MDNETQEVVETISATPMNKKVLVGVAAGLIAAGAVAVYLKVRKDKAELEFDRSEVPTEA